LINAPVHDALLISIPRGNEDKDVKIAQRIMEESAEFVIGNKIRVGIEKVDPHFKVKEKHKEIFNLIFKKLMSLSTWLNHDNNLAHISSTYV
jgi:hypothetical protein